MQFWKMHGLGNDYVVIDNRDQKISDEGKVTYPLAKQLCETTLLCRRRWACFLFIHQRLLM